LYQYHYISFHITGILFFFPIADSSTLVDMHSKEFVHSVTYNIQENYNTSVLEGTIVTDQLAMCLNAVNKNQIFRIYFHHNSTIYNIC
jgi:hypothetical protein